MVALSALVVIEINVCLKIYHKPTYVPSEPFHFPYQYTNHI